MEESAEMRWLREAWDSELIKRHENQWIAIRGEQIIASADSLAEVLSNISTLEFAPLLTKVVHGPIQ